MELTARDLNRTLLARQHLLSRVPPASGTAAGDGQVRDTVEHLVGLQAQDNLPPYLSLAARLDDFDPYAVTRALESRKLVRLVVMRGTIHLLTAGDALTLRQWTQPVQDRERRASQTIEPAAGVDLAAFDEALSTVLADGPLPMKTLGATLTRHFPDVPATALAQLARVQRPLVQLPPRGCWKQSGGVVLDPVDRWLAAPLRQPDPEAVVRRYLAVFGPATAADVGAWSGLTGMAGVLRSMPDLVRHTDESGRTLFDVPGGAIAPGDAPAPVRLLGAYDNVWLSHAGRDRVTAPAKRKRWMGGNGGVANTVFVDGWLEGLWRVEDGNPVVVELFRDLTPAERRELDNELQRVEAMLRR